MRPAARHNYTLVELIAVIIIVAIVASIGVLRLRATPTFITLEKQVDTIKTMLAISRNAATRLRRPVRIWLNRENHTLNAAWIDPKQKIRKKVASITLNPDMQFEFGEPSSNQDENADTVELLKMFPDGSGGGHDIVICWRQRRVKIHVSPLTGTIQARQLEDAECD